MADQTAARPAPTRRRAHPAPAGGTPAPGRWTSRPTTSASRSTCGTTKLAAAGEELAAARRSLLERLEPEVDRAHRDLVGDRGAAVTLTYEASWHGPLAEALAAGRTEDVRRRATLRGPHRDELAIGLAGLPARTHASQGEQRSLALALRLGVHRLLTDRLDTAPVLLLDDVFSELDPDRSAALLAHLPDGPGCGDHRGGPARRTHDPSRWSGSSTVPWWSTDEWRVGRPEADRTGCRAVPGRARGTPAQGDDRCQHPLGRHRRGRARSGDLTGVPARRRAGRDHHRARGRRSSEVE